MAGPGVTAAGTRGGPARWVRALALLVPPALVAIAVGAVGLELGTLIPFEPFALDLGIYRRAGEQVLTGQDFYARPVGGWPFIYPPFAALLSVPLALLAWPVAVIAWAVLNAGLLMLIGRRFGLAGWRLSVFTAAVIIAVEPIRITIAFGQINIALLALVLLDLLPAPGRRRRGPVGWLAGVATGIKLTPGIFAVQQFLAGRRRVALIIFGTFLASVIIGFAILPGASVTFWTRLVGGDSGINDGIFHYTNQSVLGNAVRLFGADAQRPALAVAAVAGLAGLAAGALWQRLDQPALGLCLTGFAALVASPISWSHHYVWVLPLGLVLLRRAGIPWGLRVSGWALVGYVALAPFNLLPYAEQETWPLWIRLADAAGLALALIFLGTALVLGVRRIRARPRAGATAAATG
ncbi:glycosyltransferase 87 family protein [Naumannella huperziae]